MSGPPQPSPSQRFQFGSNWKQFLTVLDEDRIHEAEESLKRRLRREDLLGLSFLDAGSGSGLFSLAARRLGATVRSFDYDPVAVDCAVELRRRYFPDDSGWIVTRGDVVDEEWMDELGSFDVVYSWGVLHHTGEMWKAIGNVTERVNAGGHLFISIYNDQGRGSQRWRWIKRTYNEIPNWARAFLIAPAFLRFWGATFLLDVLRGRGFSSWRTYGKNRGMSAWHDLVDWVGGYPFEVARPEEIFEFMVTRGFELTDLKTCGGGIGCNEFVFRK